jgi:hypothetical protein
VNSRRICGSTQSAAPSSVVRWDLPFCAFEIVSSTGQRIAATDERDCY